MQRAIIYSRVSTDEQAQKGYSLRDQVAKLESYCIDKEIEIVRHFQDDFSAKTFERPEFKKLILFVKKNRGVINKLIVIKWDRFARNMEAALNMISLLLQYGVTVEAIEQPLDDSIPENYLLKAFYLAAPQVENHRRSLNTISGMRKALKEGRWIGHAPFGFKNERDENNKPILQRSEKAELVLEAFKLYATGSYEREQVRNLLSLKGMYLSKQSFSEMLNNPIYCGKIKVRAYKNEPEEIVPGLHEAIVSEELFEQVQLVCLNRKRFQAKNKKKLEELPLRGSLICSKCGKNLTGSASIGNGGKYFYYHCQSGCKERYQAEIAHKSFTHWLESLTLKPEIASLYIEIMEDLFKSDGKDRKTEVLQLEKQVKEKKELRVKASIKLVNDEIDNHTFSQLKERLDGEVLELSSRVSELKEGDNGFLDHCKFGFSLLSNLNSFYQQADLNSKQKLISSIFPEKLSFTGKEYRTSMPSEILNLLFLNQSDLQGVKIKLPIENDGQSGKVAGARLELTTFGL